MSSSFCHHRTVARRPFGTRFLDLAPFLTLAVGGWLAAHPVVAATYTYSNVNGGTTQWSAGTDWNAVPVSGPSTSLLFTGTQAVSAATVSNNDISGTFALTGATVTVAGTTGSTYAITGNALAFSSTSGTATFLINPAGTKPTVQINNALVVNTGVLLISNNNSNTTFFNVNGVVSGTGMLALKSSGTGGYNNANAASGAGGLNSSNSFSGGFWFQQGTLYTGSSALSAVVGMTGQNSMLGSAGSITLGSIGTSGTLRLTPTASGTTDRTIIVGGTGGATIYMNPVNSGTTTFGMGAITSGTGGDRRIVFNTAGSNTDVFAISGVVSDNADGSKLAINVAGSGNGAVILSNTANSFSGGVSIQGNTTGRTYDVSVPRIGVTGSNSSLGTSGTIGLGGSNGFAMLTWTGTANETTDKVINLTSQATAGVAAIENNGTAVLTFTSDTIVTGVAAKNFNFYGTGTTNFAGRIGDYNSGSPTSIRKGSNGTLILSGSNTYTGTTDVNQGTLQFTSGALDASSAILFSNVGILQYASGNTQDVSAKFQFTTGSAAATINTNGNDVTFSTAIAAGASGTGAGNTFYKSGLGTLTLAPASGNNGWANGTVIQQGVLNFASLGALGGGTIRVSSGTLQYGAGVTDDISGRFTLTAGSYGAIDTNGNNVTFASPVVATGAGNGGLIKAGAGTLTLTASASYTLGTTVNGGTLALGSGASLGSSAFVSVAAGATLDVRSVPGGFTVAPTQSVAGLGTVAGSMTVGGGATVAPGTAPGTSLGTLSVSQDVTWGSSGNYNWQMLSGTGSAGTGTSWDLLTVGGTLSIAATAADPFKINLWTLTSTSTAGDVSGTAANFNPAQNYTWKIAGATGGITGFAADKFLVNTSATNGTGGFANGLSGGTFSIVRAGNEIDLVFTAAAPSAITINVASGTQTQTQAGYATLSGSVPVVKTGAGTLVVNQANTLTGSTTVQGGRLQLANGAALASSRLVPVAGGTVTLSPGLQTTVGGLAANAGGLTDVGNGMVTVASGLSTADMLVALGNGRGDGSWNGTSGITSSAANQDLSQSNPRTVGWLDNGDGSVTFAYAAPGDTNLDWTVDILDAANFLAGGKFDSGTPATWNEGDFGYDGVVDILDAADFLSTGLFDAGPYNSAPGSVAAVPEPSGLAWVAAAAACGVWLRRRAAGSVTP
ncbi:MAG: autotransporter-associated beta strand repeat-containing protein [Planctomycetes bacterium]|nr:autotransporter-associated beta strand repeat-containing protein [Planctomycetota bacterium]